MTEQLTHLIDGQALSGREHFAVTDPYRGEIVCRAPDGSADDIDRAVSAATRAAPEVAGMPAYERAAILRRAAQLVVERADEIGRVMARETGKAINDARAEVKRSTDTLSLSAEEAIRIEGEHVPLDGSMMGHGKLAVITRFPVGVVGAITPFNAPFNLACHKLGPSFAAGNATVIKPPQQCPMVVHRLVELLYDAGMPRHFINLVHGGPDAGRALVRDERVAAITFTGSSKAGREIRAMAGLRKVVLELGGNGPTIVCDDADVDAAAPLLARNATRLAGQSCISVQNIFVHRSLAAALSERVATHMASLNLGDPLEDDTDIGTLIDEDAARRVEQWVGEAVGGGATLETGGRRHGAAFEPTLLGNVRRDARIVCDEIFGPVANVIAFDQLDEAVEAVNASAYGLQCGVLSSSLETCMALARRLRTGGVILGGTSTWRTDQLAYGGVKDSGIGREGPKYAIRDLTEERLILFNV